MSGLSEELFLGEELVDEAVCGGLLGFWGGGAGFFLWGLGFGEGFLLRFLGFLLVCIHFFH